jgi:hypothetical protein
MNNIQVIIWEPGALGAGMAEFILAKKGVDIAGAAGRGRS